MKQGSPIFSGAPALHFFSSSGLCNRNENGCNEERRNGSKE